MNQEPTPLRTLRAFYRLARDPNDTTQVFEIVQAFEGQGTRDFDRFRRSPSGKLILQERRDLLSTLRDRQALAAMPEGSLGRAYLEYCERNQFDADGLVAASGNRSRLTGDELFFSNRVRDAHDLWHVVTGWDTDVVGELALLGFTFAQTRDIGVAIIAAGGYLHSFYYSHSLQDARFDEARRLIRRGLRDGQEATWLPAVLWEELLPQSLDSVRAQLQVRPAPDYERIRAEEIAA